MVTDTTLYKKIFFFQMDSSINDNNTKMESRKLKFEILNLNIIRKKLENKYSCKVN